jgi:threonine aldolase
MRVVDLRSDTITRPTSNMRRAMAEAEVGDDVLGEDPTINRLQEMAAERLNTEAALFVPSGTMGNLVSALTHCSRGDEVILGNQAHMFCLEGGGMAAVGGIHPRPLQNAPDGTISIEEIEGAIRPDDVHHPRTRLIAVENTHNRCYGSPLTPSYMGEIRKLADRYGLKVHVDGARIFNSAVAQGIDVRDLTAAADSVSFCLSKGLGAPAGSLICSSRDFIARARRMRKMLGGGMRQAGILAAAGIVALEEMVERLAEDHANAQRLGEVLSGVPGVAIRRDLITTNIVYIGIEREGLTAQALAQKLRAGGVLVGPTAPRMMRAVLQYHVTSDDIEYVLRAFEEAMS